MKVEYHGKIGWYAVASFDERLLPSRAGFVWDNSCKMWVTSIDSVAFKLADKFGETARARAAVLKSNNLEKAAGLEKADERLYPYQREGVAHLLTHHRVLLADEMGLGKTAQILQSVEIQKLEKVLVVCPATLRFVWRNEAEEWAPSRALVVCKKPIDLEEALGASAANTNIFVVSYDLLRSVHSKKPALLNKSFDLVVFDESHKIKNSKSKQSLAAAAVCRNSARVVLASGTPILNRPKELYFPLRLLMWRDFGNQFGSWADFHVRYCAGKQGRFGWEIDGASNLEELNSKLLAGANMLRRKKEQVLNLPDFIRTVVPFEIKESKGEKKLVEQISLFSDFDEALLNMTSGKAAFEEIAEVRRLAGEQKITPAISFIQDSLESGPVVVFAHHKTVIRGIVDGLNSKGISTVEVTGDVTGIARENAVKSFQSGDVQVCVCSIQAAGAGITLTASSQEVFVEFPWDPGNLAQAEARCHRIGTKDSVNAYYLVADGGIDSHILKLILRKKEIQKVAIDG